MSAPRKRCQALFADGKQCGKMAHACYSYHGNEELYDYEDPRPKWVVVYLCESHRGNDRTYHEWRKELTGRAKIS